METLIHKAAEYAETRIELLRLKTISKSSTVISDLLTQLIIAVLILLCFSIFNMGLALLIGHAVGKFYYGFFILSGFYGLALFIFILVRKSHVKKAIANSILKKILDAPHGS